MGDWREHVAGPMLRNALLCSRCGEVLWVRPQDSSRTGSPWPEGCRMASDGQHVRGDISGWPYTPCEPWQPKVGDTRSTIVPVPGTDDTSKEQQR